MISILNGPFVNKKWISKSWKQGHSILPHQIVGMADSCTFSSARPLEVASGKGHGHRHWATSAVQRKTAALTNLLNQEGRAETGVSLAAKRKKHIMTALLNFFLFLKKFPKLRTKLLKAKIIALKAAIQQSLVPILSMSRITTAKHKWHKYSWTLKKILLLTSLKFAIYKNVFTEIVEQSS